MLVPIRARNCAKTPVVTGITNSAIVLSDTPIIITQNGCHICPPEEASHWSTFPLTVGVTIWRNQFRDTSHSLGAAQSTIVTLFGDEGG